MLELLKDWKGKVEVNGIKFDSIAEASNFDFDAQKDTIHIKLLHDTENTLKSSIRSVIDDVKDANEQYKITVKQYMTKKATIDFDFMEKWNNNKPMPMRTMVGTIEKETKGMVYMHLHGYAQETITCMCCGKELTNPVSRKYGIGPICLSKIGIFTDIENVADIKEQLVKIEWSGWVIKSAIIEKEKV